MRAALLAADLAASLRRWSTLIDLVWLLFAEPIPAPIKQWLWRAGLIAAPELGLPMTGVSLGSSGCSGRAMRAWTLPPRP